MLSRYVKNELEYLAIGDLDLSAANPNTSAVRRGQFVAVIPLLRTPSLSKGKKSWYGFITPVESAS